jgi:hypothetical protein
MMVAIRAKRTSPVTAKNDANCKARYHVVKVEAGQESQDREITSAAAQSGTKSMAITLAQLTSRYWGYAAQCLILAQRQDSTGDKLALIEMAERFSWRRR